MTAFLLDYLTGVNSMKIIRSAALAESSCLGKQKIDLSKKYRLISYNMQVDTSDGLLLYNNLTDELVLLDDYDKAVIEQHDFSSVVFNTLIEKWFFVPELYDDVTLCNQVNSFMHLIYDAAFNSKKNAITEYTILTTTECNARCFYCYEAGREKITMTESVANDVADFIIKSAADEPVTFRWFGGEPLYNLKAIDVICTKLQESKIQYQSDMISNGYLFDEKIIAKALRLWNLKSVQITLDGTENVYNRCKSYIYADGNPYRRVIGNVELLLKSGINVKIRMNADEHNFQDLFNLTDFLYDTFGKYSNFKVYSHLLFEDGNNLRSYDRRRAAFSKHIELQDYISQMGLQVKYTLKDYLRYHQCMADNPSATVILPDGHLGRCEHFSDTEFSGSIYSTEKNQDVIERFRKIRVLPQKCDKCPLRPACIQLEMCPDLPAECDELYLESYMINTSNRIKNTYYEYKNQKNEP